MTTTTTTTKSYKELFWDGDDELLNKGINYLIENWDKYQGPIELYNVAVCGGADEFKKWYGSETFFDHSEEELKEIYEAIS